ncbi:MAG: NAD(+)/NADH kinase, partial [Candidatus Thermoplasmatota archaeon]|nr:NAD(+)/NADH kinase [Candidatus Thermoplasmatota archaeon]
MNNLLVVFKKNHEQVHDGALSTVISTLDKAKQAYGFEFRTVPREEVERDDFLATDAVIVLGGDGTLTSIAHSVDDQTLVMGVNSHPMDKEGVGSFGFFMGSNPSRFAQDLTSLIEGSCIINTLPRLQAEIMTTSGNIIRSDPA